MVASDNGLVAARSPVSVRLALVKDAAQVDEIYNQGIAGRGATFETAPRPADESA